MKASEVMVETPIRYTKYKVESTGIVMFVAEHNNKDFLERIKCGSISIAMQNMADFIFAADGDTLKQRYRLWQILQGVVRYEIVEEVLLVKGKESEKVVYY